jgi:hypothetical protein
MMSTQELNKEVVVYQLTAVIYPREQGPFLGIFRDETTAQALIDQTPESQRKLLRIEPIIVGRTARYRYWLEKMADPFIDTHDDHE